MGGSDCVLFYSGGNHIQIVVSRVLLGKPLFRAAVFAPPALHPTLLHSIAPNGGYDGRRASNVSIETFKYVVILIKTEIWIGEHSNLNVVFSCPLTAHIPPQLAAGFVV